MLGEHVAEASLESDYLARLLDHIVAILRACGAQDGQIDTAFKEALRKPERSPVVLRDLGTSPEFHLACCDAVFRWRHEPEYLDRSGLPLILPVQGVAPSFAALVANSGLIGFDDCLAYLEALGAIARTPEGLVALRMESVLACSGHEGLAVSSQTVLAHVVDFVSTVRFNLENKESNESGRFERACFGRIPESYIPILQRLLDERGQNLIDGVDEWLARNGSASTETSRARFVGVGAYMYVRPVS